MEASIRTREPTSEHASSSSSLSVTSESMSEEEFSGEADGYDILAQSGIFSEYQCPFCEIMFVGKAKCTSCHEYCHEDCSTTEEGQRLCYLCRRRNLAVSKRKVIN